MQPLPVASLPLNWTLPTSLCAVRVCSSQTTRPYKCGSLLTAPPTPNSRKWAVSSTSWDCRLAQSTLWELLYPTYLEWYGSTLQSDLYLVRWCGQSNAASTHLLAYSSLIPLPSGHPSTPQVTITPTAGGLTVQLTVMYPGTREDTLQYSISTSASPTGQQPLPVTDLTTPVSGSAEVALGPGTYSVTVTVTNEHNSTTSAPQQVTIPGWFFSITLTLTHTPHTHSSPIHTCGIVTTVCTYTFLLPAMSSTNSHSYLLNLCVLYYSSVSTCH